MRINTILRRMTEMYSPAEVATKIADKLGIFDPDCIELIEAYLDLAYCQGKIDGGKEAAEIVSDSFGGKHEQQ
jgi:hypothetical protein